MISIKDVIHLFPKKAEQAEKNTKLYIRQAKKRIASIIEIDDENRTFLNTFKPLDNVLGISDVAIYANVTQLLEMVSPNASIRDAAHQALIKIKSFFVDVMSNKNLYDALKYYVEHNISHEDLTEEQCYFIHEIMQRFERNGLHLPDAQLQEVKKLQKEIAELSMQFSKNIAADITTITVSRSELEGLDDDFIQALKTTTDGEYILGIDYPTYFAVMEKCIIPDTRKKLYLAFSNRAYPQNEEILEDLLIKRNLLADYLGYDSFAFYDLAHQMVQSVDRAKSFLNKLIDRAAKKEQQEFIQLTKDLPKGVQLDNGKLLPWDIAFLKEYYKKKHFNVDEQKIAEYFPVEQTLAGLLTIYASFFSLRFEEVVVKKLWSNDVRALKVFDHDEQLLGYILLDLYPRAHKYSHACNQTIIPTVFDKNGKSNVGVTVIIANFPKAQGDKPPLFKRSDVDTFFHEFGHALHGILGRTHIAIFSGYETKTDFVELPSQMLEEWLYDKDIISMISGHYKTGEPLPDELIDRILVMKHFDTGYLIMRQAFLSLLSLLYHEAGSKDLQQLQQKLHTTLLSHYYFVPEAHFYASFGHLSEYAAKYYGYLWSKVFALDVFAQIKKHGLLNPEIGKKYVVDILSKGGSVDPNILLRNFLGREPNDEAFFADMGL